MNLKKIGKVFTSKFVGTGSSSFGEIIYRAAVSQRLRDTGVDRFECLASLPGRFTSGERTQVLTSGGWMGPRVALDSVEKRKLYRPCRKWDFFRRVVRPYRSLLSTLPTQPVCTGGSADGRKTGRGSKLTLLYLVPRLRFEWIYTSTPANILTAWCVTPEN